MYFRRRRSYGQSASYCVTHSHGAGGKVKIVRSEYQHEGKDFRNLALLLEKGIKGESPSKLKILLSAKSLRV